METPKTLLFEVREHVAHITLNRPEVSNAMNLEMSREFYEAAFECEQSSDLRAVLITGAGRAFCSGGDVKSFAAQEPSRPPTTGVSRCFCIRPSIASPECAHPW